MVSGESRVTKLNYVVSLIGIAQFFHFVVVVVGHNSVVLLLMTL